jgi:hypothetical protein
LRGGGQKKPTPAYYLLGHKNLLHWPPKFPPPTTHSC